MENPCRDAVGLQPTEPGLLYQKPTNHARRMPIQKVESNRFSRADLENKLLMVDDDMDLSALPKTNYIKSIVTSECKMDMERKGVQSYAAAGSTAEKITAQRMEKERL